MMGVFRSGRGSPAVGVQFGHASVAHTQTTTEDATDAAHVGQQRVANENSCHCTGIVNAYGNRRKLLGDCPSVCHCCTNQ
jgi:hypothetical protein